MLLLAQTAATGDKSVDLAQLFGELIKQLLVQYPVIGTILIIAVIVFLVIGIFRMVTATEGTVLWGFKYKREFKELREAREDIVSLVDETRMLSFILRLAYRSLRRFDNIRSNVRSSRDDDGRQYLCEQIARSYGYFGSDSSKVVLFEKEGDKLVVWHQSGLDPESARELRFEYHPMDPTKDTFAAMAFRHGEIIVCNDVNDDPRYVQQGPPALHPYRSIMAVPVKHGDEVVAVYTVDSLAENRFDADQEEQGRFFASLFALFIPAKSSLALPPMPGSAATKDPGKDVTPRDAEGGSNG